MSFLGFLYVVIISIVINRINIKSKIMPSLLSKACILFTIENIQIHISTTHKISRIMFEINLNLLFLIKSAIINMNSRTKKHNANINSILFPNPPKPTTKKLI